MKEFGASFEEIHVNETNMVISSVGVKRQGGILCGVQLTCSSLRALPVTHAEERESWASNLIQQSRDFIVQGSWYAGSWRLFIVVLDVIF
jgi:hypothetical protein